MPINAILGTAITTASTVMGVTPISAIMGQTVVSGGGSYLVSIDVDGAGTPAGWTDTGSPNWAYTTSPIVGTYSLNCPAGTGNNTYVSFTGQADVWAFARLRRDSTPGSGDENIMRLADSSGLRSAGIVTVGSYGGMKCVAYAAESGTGGNVSNGTNMAVWIHFVKNTSVDVWIQTDGSETRPGSVYGSLSGATSTTDAARLYLSGLTSTNTVWDKIRVSASEIGSNPS